MKRTFYILILPILLFGLFGIAEAHQPRLIYKIDTTSDKPFVIENPQISQAFYGELKGESDFFSVAYHNPGNLYFQILSPDIKDAKTDFVAELSLVTPNGNIKKETLSGGKWEKFYEEFGDDNYLQGPDKTVALGKGLYQIKISNIKNEGKYVLVIGKEEAFPPNEAINAFLNMPSLKKDFFNKPVWTAYYNKIGMYSGITIFVVLIILYILFRFIRR